MKNKAPQAADNNLKGHLSHAITRMRLDNAIVSQSRGKGKAQNDVLQLQYPMQEVRKYGPKKIQRYRCQRCKSTFSDPQEKPLDKMRISLEKALHAINLLVEGCGIRVVSRITGLLQ